MTNYKQVLDWFKEGKKIRRLAWPRDQYIYINNGKFCDEKFVCVEQIWVEELLKEGWELYEEKKHFCFHPSIASHCKSSAKEGDFIVTIYSHSMNTPFCPFCGEKAAKELI